MNYRKLRIAWSVGWGILCLLLIALWVRSYWWITSIHTPPIASRGLQCALERSRIRIESYPLHTAEEKADGIARVVHIHKSNPDFAWWNRHILQEPSFALRLNELKPGSIRLIFPYWFAILITAMASFAPWLPWRFSLRTLLIAATVIAVGLGVIVWAAK
jgi:hypothetical protein